MKAEIGSGDASRGLPPVVAFLVVAALAIAGSLVWLIGGRDSTADPTPNPPTTTVDSTLLTEAEAITEFNRLNVAILDAIASRDFAAVRAITTAGGSTRENFLEVVRQHRQANVVDESRVEILNIEAVAISEDELRLRVVDVTFPCFRSESGSDVSKGPGEIRKTSTWVLIFEGTWKLHRGVLEDYEEVKDETARC